MKDVRFDIKARDKTRKVFSRVIGGLKKMLGAVFSLKGALGVALSLAGLGYLVKQSLDATDRLGKMSKTLGIATEDLATFNLMADLGGSSLDTFARASRQVSNNVFDYVVRGTGIAADAFKVLGISVAQLRPIMNDQVAVLGLVADGLNRLPDGSVKTAVAYKLLGGRATELLPALAGGSAAFRAARIEAEQFGIALSKKTVKGVEDANDSITRLLALFRGGRDQLVANFAPALTFVTDLIRGQLQTALKNSGLTVETWAQGIVLKTIDMISNIVKATQKLVNGTVGVIDKIKSKLKDYGLMDKTTSDRVQFWLGREIKRRKELLAIIDKRSKNPFLSRMTEDFQTLTTSTDSFKQELAAVNDEIKGMKSSLAAGGGGGDNGGLISDGALKKTLAFLDKIRAAALKAFNKPKTDNAGGNDPTAPKIKNVTDFVNKAKNRMQTYFDDTNDKFKQTQIIGMDAFGGIEDAFVKFARTGKLSFKGLINSMIADFARLMAKKFITSLFGGGGPLGGLGKIFGFAGGGRPPVGQASIVGENGPEIFIPDSAGTIIPNHRSFGGGRGAGGAVTNNYINIDARQATDPAAVAHAAEIAVLKALPATVATAKNRVFDTLRRPSIA